MFLVGQQVWHRNGQRSGTVLECDGDTVFIVQENGVEVEFRAAELSATPPASAQPAGRAAGTAASAAASYAMPGRALTARDITAEHMRVLASVPARMLQEIAGLHERRPKAGRFSALDPAAKLNLIAEITAVPYRVMRTHIGSPGELGLLMGKGLADARKAGQPA